MRYPLLVFDWDGTLIDSAPTIVACIQAACRDLGLPVPDDARASHVIGLGLQDALAYAIPGLPLHDYGRMVERQPGDGVSQRVLQAETYDVARSRVVG
ncbi:MAG TPA: HAD hydrolase-like protein, partial [Burkholderiales bacterium]|nr:HAD hydrolase-like protein [Burkholderiales bacterium]